MSDDPGDRRGDEGLRFFGHAAAGLSHELRNVLATVQQAAGLLDDYSALIAQGRPVDPERYQLVTARIARNADRGLDYIDLLHWLGHSLDGARSSLDLNEIAQGAVALARYRARQRRIELELERSEQSAVVIGRTFEWVMFVHRCVEAMMALSGDGATVLVALGEGPDGVVLRLESDRRPKGSPDAAPALERIADLAGSIGGRVETAGRTEAGQRVVLRLQ